MSDHHAFPPACRQPAEQLFLDLVGPLRLHDGLGADLTPTGAKAQGMLALLGTSPAMRRSRVWLQDKLWSDRPPEQGAASLRQCLLRTRSALGGHAGCLVADRTSVTLDPGCVCVRKAGDPAAPDAEFLEGLDVRDPEFEDWLRNQRLTHAERSSCGREDDTSLAAAGTTPSSGLPVVGLVSRFAGEGVGVSDGGGQFVADEMIDMLATALLDHAIVELVDLRTPAEWHMLSGKCGPRWLLCAAASVWRGRVRIALTLTEVRLDRLRWTEARTFDLERFDGGDAGGVRQFARDAAQRVGLQTFAPEPARPRNPRPLGTPTVRAA